MAGVMANVFVCLWLCHMFWFHASSQDPFHYLWQKYAGSVVWYLGLHYAWDMFAPNPIHVNRRLVAELILSNGEQRRWESDRFGADGLLRGFLTSRDRKFVEEISNRDFQGPRIAFAQALARQESRPEMSVVKVVLAIEMVVVNHPSRVHEPPPPMKRLEILVYPVT